MKFAWTEEQQMFQEALRSALSKECTAAQVRAAWAAEEGRSPGLWEKLVELGLVGMLVPESLGGLGMSALEVALSYLGEHPPEPDVEATAVGRALSELQDPASLVARIIACGLAGDPVEGEPHESNKMLLVNLTKAEKDEEKWEKADHA